MTEQVYWSRYFDIDVSRGSGRKVPLELAVEDPTVKEISTAVTQIGYNCSLEPNVAHPQEPYDGNGCVLVETSDSKTDVLHAIAAYIPVIRDT